MRRLAAAAEVAIAELEGRKAAALDVVTARGAYRSKVRRFLTRGHGRSRSS